MSAVGLQLLDMCFVGGQRSTGGTAADMLRQARVDQDARVEEDTRVNGDLLRFDATVDRRKGSPLIVCVVPMASVNRTPRVLRVHPKRPQRALHQCCLQRTPQAPRHAGQHGLAWGRAGHQRDRHLVRHTVRRTTRLAALVNPTQDTQGHLPFHGVIDPLQRQLFNLGNLTLKCTGGDTVIM